MAYSELLAQRIRDALARRRGVSERKMFGGLAFMVQGNMCCGVIGDDLMLRVGPKQYAETLALPGARPMDFTGRPLNGMVYVAAESVGDDTELDAWLKRGLAFVRTLPAKGPTADRVSRKTSSKKTSSKKTSSKKTSRTQKK